MPHAAGRRPPASALSGAAQGGPGGPGVVQRATGGAGAGQGRGRAGAARAGRSCRVRFPGGLRLVTPPLPVTLRPPSTWIDLDGSFVPAVL